MDAVRTLLHHDLLVVDAAFADCTYFPDSCCLGSDGRSQNWDGLQVAVGVVQIPVAAGSRIGGGSGHP